MHLRVDAHAIKIATLSALSLAVLASCNAATLKDRKEDYYEKHPVERAKNWFKEGLNGEKDLIDPNKDLAKKDYEDLFYNNPKGPSPAKSKLALPGVGDLLVAPATPVISNDKKVSISVTEDVPLRDVFIELARRADIDVELGSGITGGVIFRAKERPFSEVIERLTKLAGLVYTIDDGILRVRNDTPYIANYRMNLLNQIRTSSSSVSVNTDVSGGDGNVSSGSGSSSTITADSSEGDVWQIIEDGIASVISQYGNAAEAAPTASGEGNGIISVNRPAGILSVVATRRQHEEIKEYLDKVYASHSTQVLIEAKVVEVELNDDHRSGIDWTFASAPFSFGTNFDNIGVDAAVADQLFTVGVLPSELFGWNDTSISATVELVDEFGVTKTLSSPRINAMNNQHAVLTFVENFVYFETTVEEEEEDDGSGGTSNTLTVESEAQYVPIGVILSLQPSIDVESQEIVMNVRPTLTRISSFTQDPGVVLQLASFGLTNDGTLGNYPVVETRELDSVLRMKNGQVMVIGGLMEERTSNTDRGVPVLSDVPLLGNAFKTSLRDTTNVETVIFIKATIIPSTGAVSVDDKEFYRKFTSDRNPFNI